MFSAHATPSRLGDYFEPRQERGRAGLPTLSVTLTDGLVLRSELERRTESALEAQDHLLVRVGDLAYNTMRMWQGACGVADQDGLISPAYVVMAPRGGIDSRFAYHWFKTPRMRHLLRSYSHGLTEDRLRLYADEFAQIPASPPSLDAQRRWATALDACDEIIARAEKLLEAKRRRLANVRKLILSQLAEPEIEIGEIAAVTSGVPAPQDPSAFASEGVRFMRVSDLSALMGEVAEEPEYLSVEAARSMRRFPAGTILFAKSGMSCKLARVTRLPAAACLVSHLAAVNAKDDAYQSFLFHWLVEHPPSSLIQGDAFPSIKVTAVAAMSVPNLSAEAALQVGETLDTLQSDVRTELDRLSAFRRQKRALMQRLHAENPSAIESA